MEPFRELWNSLAEFWETLKEMVDLNETDEDYMIKHFDKDPKLYYEYLELVSKASKCREGKIYTIIIGDREFGVEGFKLGNTI